MMTKRSAKREILIDEPTGQDWFQGKGHERTADALAIAIGNFRDKDRSIGLDGPWGSGKSSVVEIAKARLQNGNGNGKIKFHFFTFDIWNSQGSPFRRSFLEHFLDWTSVTFPNHASKLKAIEKRVKGKVREVDSDNQFLLDWYGICVLLTLPFLPIYYFWAKDWFDAFSKANNEWEFVFSLPFILLVVAVALTIFVAILRFFKEDKDKKTTGNVLDQFRIAMSQTLLINAKQYEKQKVTQYIREIDPNDFEFQATFREILSVVQSDNERVILVLDNIDRLPKNEIAEYWALVRAVFSRHPLSKSMGTKNTVTVIVPYDRQHIGPEVVASANDAANQTDTSGKISPLSGREIFSKTFDEILTVSPPVMSNSRDFFQQKIAQALPEFNNNDELFRVYLIFNRILQEENGKATPRQIIAFINELTGLYVLHNEQFGLATVAVYIAYQDELELRPSCLTRPEFINERIRNLASDQNLERNLAALIFNVEPELAFQLLLDEQIKIAAVSNGPEKLREIAISPGFDLRVNEVVQSNLKEWLSSNEFVAAVQNFSSLYEGSKGAAARDCTKSLNAGFTQIASIELAPKAYSPYLTFYKICEEEDTLAFSKHLVSRVSNGLGNNKEAFEQEGRAVVKFLLAVQKSLKDAGLPTDIDELVPVFHLPSSADFMVGLADALHETGISLKSFKDLKLDLPEGVDIFGQVAISQPKVAINAFSEFQRAGLISNNTWISVGNSLIEYLSNEIEGDPKESSNQIELLCACWVSTNRLKRSEINIEEAFASANFIQNTHNILKNGSEDKALANFLFLAGEACLEGGLDPTGVDDGEHVAGAEAAERLRQILEGELALPDWQTQRLSELLKRSGQVAKWTDIGIDAPENKFVSSVVKQAYLSGEMPPVTPDNFLLVSNYLKGVSGRDWPEVLTRSAQKLDNKAFSDLKLEALPRGLLNDTKDLLDKNWLILHEKVTSLLNEVSAIDWKGHFEGADAICQLAAEKIQASEYVSDSPAFRDGLFEFIVSVLNGDLTPPAFNFDTLIQAVSTDFHPEFFRKVRENLRSVSVDSLRSAVTAFPRIISELVSGGERITKPEKDTIVRHLLCVALEGQIESFLNIYLQLPRTKVTDYIKQSELATQAYLEGAQKQFARDSRDRDFARRIGEMIHGKRKPKTWWDIWLGSSDDEA